MTTFKREVQVQGKTISVFLEIDIEGIAQQLVHRARHSRTKKSAFMGGKVILKIVSEEARQ